MTDVLGVVFDFYGTLVEEHPADAERDRQLLAERGYHLSGAVQRAWVDPFTALDHRDDSADRQRYQRRRSELWRIALAEAGVDAEHLDELATLAETCDATRRYVAYPDVVDALAHLRHRGLGTAICSNWGWDLAQTVTATGLDGRVDAVVTSAQAGFRKPHPEVFSTVAVALGEKVGLPVIHLDRIYWRPGWVETPLEEWRQVQEGLVAADTWIIDGNHATTLDIRLGAADTVVMLDFSRWRCLVRAVVRSLRFRGRTRVDRAEGCPERLDRTFVSWVWTFPNKGRPQLLEAVAEHAAAARFVQLRNPRAVKAFLEASAPN